MEWLIAQLVKVQSQKYKVGCSFPIDHRKEPPIFNNHYWLCSNPKWPTRMRWLKWPKFTPFGLIQIKIRTCTIAHFVLGTALKQIFTKITALLV